MTQFLELSGLNCTKFEGNTGQPSPLSTIVLSFRHIAPFRKEVDANATVIERCDVIAIYAFPRGPRYCVPVTVC